MSTAPQEKLIVVEDRAKEAMRLPAPTVSQDASALMKIIDRAAMDPNFDVAKLQQLLEVHERWEANEARKAFVAAMSRFKAEVPTILKSKAVNIPGGAQFSHATLAAVCDAVIPRLSEFGFSHGWEIDQKDRQITVTCVMTHELGHEKRTTLTGAPDDSGKKNAIQQVASTVTYLERYTLMAATGLAARDMDNDGAVASGGNGGQLSEKEAADHLAAIDGASRGDLLRVFGVAWNAAEKVKDKGAQRLFIQHRDARKAQLGVKS